MAIPKRKIAIFGIEKAHNYAILAVLLINLARLKIILGFCLTDENVRVSITFGLRYLVDVVTNRAVGGSV